MIVCPFCNSDDCALQESYKIKLSESYTFTQWSCELFCRSCGQNFSAELDEDERKDYL